jgi:hypothetical protein
VPNQVVLSLGVEVHAKALADARQDNDRRVRNIRAAAIRAGIDPKDIQTDFIQLGMEYENDGVMPRYFYSRKSNVIRLRDDGAERECRHGRRGRRRIGGNCGAGTDFGDGLSIANISC